MLKRKTLKVLAAALAAAACHTLAPMAQAAEDLATYQGPDRHERLVEAAKKEGELTVYHAYPKLTVAIDAFSKKYGIKVKNWRAGSEALLQRIVSEARGGRHDVDIVQNNAPENEALHREGLSRPVWSPHFADLRAKAVPDHQAWVGVTMDVWTAAYNTEKVKAEDVPKGYEDLLDPKWKNKLGVEAFNFAWFGTLLQTMGEEKGRKLFSDIVSANGMSFRKGHSLLTSLVASGEVPLALTVYSWNPEQLKTKGAPIQGLALDPVIGQFSTLAVLGQSPHPNAALLFYDFMLDEGQKILADMDYVVVTEKIKTPFTGVDVTMVDPGQALDRQDEWMKTFEQVLGKTP